MKPSEPEQAQEVSAKNDVAQYYADPDTRAIQQQLHHALGGSGADGTSDAPAPSAPTWDAEYGMWSGGDDGGFDAGDH